MRYAFGFISARASAAVVPPTVIDLTDLANVATVRANEVFVRTGLSTAGVVPANTAIIEWDDGYWGVWTHNAVTNQLAWDFASLGTDGAPVVTSGQSDPAGGSGAIKIQDTNSVAVSYTYLQSAGGNMNGLRVWAREDASTPPTSPGCITMMSGVDDWATAIVSGTAWNTYEIGFGEWPGTAGGYVFFYPSGAAPAPTFNNAATGAAHYWGLFAIADSANHARPSAKTTIPAAGVQLAGAQLSNIVKGGCLDLSCEMLPSNIANPTGSEDKVLWSAHGGAHSLRDSGGNLLLKVNGADVLTAVQVDAATAGAQHIAKRGHLRRVQTVWDPGRNESMIRVSVGGSCAFDVTGTTTGGPLPAVSDFWLGCDTGSTADVATQRYRRLISRASASRAFIPDGIVLGDSSTASFYVYGLAAVPTFILDDEEQKTDRIRSIAVPSDTIADQKARWQALPLSERAGAAWIAISVGLQDIHTTGEASSAPIARLQDLVNTINASRASAAKVLIVQMVPAKQHWIDVYGAGATATAAQAKWQDINDAIAGLGATPITGVHARVTDHVFDLDDGTGNLIAIYDMGDHFRLSNVGRQVVASACRAALVTLGLLP